MAHLPPVLPELFAALEAQKLRWTLLRVPSDLLRPTGDVDLLVDARHAERLRTVAETLGFVALPGWAKPPNLILTRYDRESDQWLLLDVDTDVVFRRPPGWSVEGAAAMVLDGRRARDGLVVPDDGDAFWLLLLHSLLDKGGVEPRYHDRLRELAGGGRRSALGPLLVGDQASRELSEACAAADWERAATAGERLAVALEGRITRADRLRMQAADAVRAALRTAGQAHRRGANITLLGPHGVGKSTLVAGLREAIPFESRSIHMGLWKHSGGHPARQVAEILLRPASLWLRYVWARCQQALGRVVVFDRYVYEAWLPAHPPLLRLKRGYHWLLAHSVPGAQAAVVLDVPGEIAFTRKQENTAEELEEERRFYAEIARRRPGTAIVDASQEADAVRADVSEVLWQMLARRWGR